MPIATAAIHDRHVVMLRPRLSRRGFFLIRKPRRSGLISYGANLADLFQSAAPFVDKILKGTKPSDLPVEQPTKFELVINLKTAKELGLTITREFLLITDEVIE